MSKEMIISSNPGETWICILENGSLFEVFIERKETRSILGNIYKGRVSKVLPGMQSAFIDIGLQRDSFLYVEDFRENLEDYEKMLGLEEELDNEKESLYRDKTEYRIEDYLQEDQDILVQVKREPLPNKGARVSTYITFPGRYLVFMPFVNYIGVSRRIEDQDERERLREIASRLKPEKAGLIVRTAAHGVNEEELHSDAKYLSEIWKEVIKKSEHHAVPSLIHEDIDLTLKLIRDYFNSDFTRVLVDSEEKYEGIVEYVTHIDSSLASRIKLYSRRKSILEKFGITSEIEKALKSRVWLKSGGYIVINQTEALVSIDVNTGKYMGTKGLEDTVLKINLEAVNEIARQIRLRNLGGIIIIDFIDMEEAKSKEKVFDKLEKALKKDRAKTKLLEISDFCLVELTRKTTRKSLDRILSRACPCCEGSGRIKSATTVSFEIMWKIREICGNMDKNSIVVKAHPEVASYFQEINQKILELELKEREVKIVIKADENLHYEQFDIVTI